MKCIQLFAILAILTFALVQAKVETTVLKHTVHCNKRVSPKSTIQVQFLKKVLETDEVLVNQTLQIAPGEETAIKELGLQKEVLGMCVGEIRRFVIPDELEVSKQGHVVDKANAYEVEVLDIENPPFFTPLFWAVLAGIGVTYIAVSALAKKEDESKDSRSKKSQ